MERFDAVEADYRYLLVKFRYMSAVDHDKTVTFDITEKVFHDICVNITFGITMLHLMDFHFMIAFLKVLHLQCVLN